MKCIWKPCPLSSVGLSVYCAEHTEEARRNTLLSLGSMARASLMWRDGDEKWLLPEVGGRK